jgi:hypothetical protein
MGKPPGVGPSRRVLLTLLCAALCGSLAAIVAHRLAPFPSASVANGSEEVFATGLFDRELPPRRQPLRWTRAQSTFRFRHLPPQPLTLAVRVHGHRGLCVVGAGNAVVGDVPLGAVRRDFEARAHHGALKVTLSCETFRAADAGAFLTLQGPVSFDERNLGTLLRSVSLSWERGGLPDARLLLFFILPALVSAAAALLARAGTFWTCASAATTATIECLILLPGGALWSTYTAQVAALLTLAAVAGGGFARWAARHAPGAGGWALGAVLVTFWVQVLLATSPLMVVSDAVFQSHVLKVVADGYFFPISRTQHAPPFQIPYGVSFFALLAPLTRLGLERVLLVRWGSALAGGIATLAVFPLLLRRSARLAGLAVILLNLLPGTFLIYSQGNLANVFGQALTLGFLIWWGGRARGGPLVGGLLFALSALGHLSSFIVLLIWAAVLLVLRTHDADALRRRRLALLLGAMVSGLYYSRFLPLIVAQLPRVLQGSGKAGSFWDPWLLQLEGIGLGIWGAPAVLLAWIGRPRWVGAGAAPDPSRASLDRTLISLWIAGGILLLLATLSPVEVRYLYALAPVVAIGAASGTEQLLARRAGWIAATALLGVQLLLAGRTIVDRLLWHYR